MKKNIVELPFVKKISLCLLLLLITCLGIQAQSVPETMLYPDFKQGTVYFKDGRSVSALLNYNPQVEEMLYKDGNVVLAIANFDEIATIDIQGDKFVHFKGKIFYQMIEAGKGIFYLQWKSNVYSQGKAAGYGGYSSTTSITNYTTIQEGGTTTKLASNEKFGVKQSNHYWIRNGKGKYVNISTLSLLQKNFPGKDVKAYCQAHNLNFGKPADMVEIMTYCFE